MNPKNYSIVILIILILGTVILFDSLVTGIVLMTFSDFFLNGIVFAPVCEPGENPNNTGCYDQDNIDGGEILSCLHSGICPIGVSWQPTGSESPYATPDSDPDVNYTPPSPSTIDQDGDGIFDDVDACPLVPESLNGILDTDGCPETTIIDPGSELPVIVNDLPDVDIIDIIVNPPDISGSFIDEVQELGFNANDLNLNDTVDSAIILVVVILVILILALIMILKKNMGKKRK